MTDAADVQADAAEETAAPPRSLRRLIVIVATLLVVVGAGIGTWYVVVPRVLHRTPTADAAPADIVKATVPLSPVVVNVSGSGKQYVRVAVSLGIAKATEAKAIEERRAEILDLLIGVLGSADAQTLASESGREELKEDVLDRIRQDLGLTLVTRVYFTEFVIQ